MKLSAIVDGETLKPSPPSRGAWIEMPHRRTPRWCRQVAPLAGGVD